MLNEDWLDLIQILCKYNLLWVMYVVVMSCLEDVSQHASLSPGSHSLSTRIHFFSKVILLKLLYLTFCQFHGL